MTLLLAGEALMVAGGIAAAIAYRRPAVANLVGPLAAVIGCLLGLVPVITVLAGGTVAPLDLPWSVPNAAWSVGLDALSAWFMVPVLVVGGIAAVYGAAYLRAYAGRKNLGAVWLAFDVMIAAMAAVVTARDGTLFLVGWEVMALSSWVLVAFEHEKADVRRAGWVYLVASHFGTAFLLAFFLLLRASGGSSALVPLSSAPVVPAGVLFALALVGFGAKIGLVPLHVWLPEAHSAAPSHVSAVMSAVLVKVGVYGLLRAMLLVGAPAWSGPLLVALGVVGALLGVRYAVAQRDIKRSLAYSTIENLGLVTIGIGLGVWGLARGDALVAALGFASALLHVWNHALMKGLMFLGAGSVLHATHTRDIEKLGGLMKKMPITGALVAVGAVAIAGLPPLNGFASEWLLYMGLAEGGTRFSDATGVAWMLGLGVIALIGGVAAAAFVRWIGIALLGQPRSEHAEHAHESSVGLWGPMAALAAGCVALGVFPGVAVGLQAGALHELGVAVPAAPLSTIGLVAALLWGVVLLVGLWLTMRLRAQPPVAGPTWGCGYAAPSPRMQYTGRGFGQIYDEGILVRALVAEDAPAAQPLFPAPARFERADEDPVLGRAYEPWFHRAADALYRLRKLQRGEANIYVAYIGAIVLIGLAWATWRNWSGS